MSENATCATWSLRDEIAMRVLIAELASPPPANGGGYVGMSGAYYERATTSPTRYSRRTTPTRAADSPAPSRWMIRPRPRRLRTWRRNASRASLSVRATPFLSTTRRWLCK
jgi:hypothetical protein